MSDAPDHQHDDEGHDEHDDDVADAVVLRASGMRWVWVLIGSMGFATLGIALVLGEKVGLFFNAVGAFVVLLFGFCAVVAIRQLLNPGSLIVSGDGIEMLHRGRLTTYMFDDCGPFATWRNPSKGTISVVFDYRPDGDTETTRANRRLMGGTRAFNDNYGMPPEALADLLNHVRRGAID